MASHEESAERRPHLRQHGDANAMLPSGVLNGNLRGDVLMGLALVSVLLPVYLTLALQLVGLPMGPYYVFDVWFGIDTPRVIEDITQFDGDHYRTKVHPIYVLLMNPLCTVVKVIFGGRLTDATLAAGATAAIGALSATLPYAVMRTLGGPRLLSFLVGLVFGVTSSQLCLSIVPDTSSLAVLSLGVTYLLFAREVVGLYCPRYLWVVAGAFTLGVTTTNAVQTGICLGVVLLRTVPPREVLRRLALWTAQTVGVVVVLALLQRLVYPSAALFFTLKGYGEEKTYTSFLILSEPLTVISQIVKHFFAMNVVAGEVAEIDVAREVPGLTFSRSWRFPDWGALVASLWGGGALFLLSRYQGGSRFHFAVGMGLCVLANMALHSIYGVGENQTIEYFLYTGNLTLALILAVFGSATKGQLRSAEVLLGAFVAVLAIHNVTTIKNIIAVLSAA